MGQIDSVWNPGYPKPLPVFLFWGRGTEISPSPPGAGAGAPLTCHNKGTGYVRGLVSTGPMHALRRCVVEHVTRGMLLHLERKMIDER